MGQQPARSHVRLSNKDQTRQSGVRFVLVAPVQDRGGFGEVGLKKMTFLIPFPSR